ncbi:MAG TPA: hypothetical protein DDW50_16815 [Firmicutes bacterium]|nr:hypothetical protein [Bacillota bacterium]
MFFDVDSLSIDVASKPDDEAPIFSDEDSNWYDVTPMFYDVDSLSIDVVSKPDDEASNFSDEDSN